MGFTEVYVPDKSLSVSCPSDWCPAADFEAGAKGLTNFVRHYGGVSFNGAVYRVHCGREISHWTGVVEEGFPEFRGRILCFSYDWLGRHFALDRARQGAGECLILMFEPGTGQALEIAGSFRTFHDTELVTYQNEALAAQFYKTWLVSGGRPPDITECIGYKKPLFLGGKDVVDNLELSDMEVYWSLCSQMLSRTRNLPNGTRIGRIDIG